MSNKDDNNEDEDEFDDRGDWGESWGDFRFGDPKFIKRIISKIMKDFLPRIKEFPDFHKMPPDEFMKKMLKNRDKFNLQGPFVYGFNVSFGPDGIPKLSKFGSIQPKKGKKEIEKNFREPLTEVMEEKDNIIVVAEMPGIKKDDIELKATEYSLIISAESAINNRRYKKSINLSSAIDPDHAKARYQNGILEIKLDKITGKEKDISID